MAVLAAVLMFAVIRPRGLPEAVVAVPGALLLVAVGATDSHAATAEIVRLAPVVGFLAAILVLAAVCDDEGLFRAAGAAMARAGRGRPAVLLRQVFLFAAGTTAILSLDATVVLLTPVILATARALGTRPRPHVYAGAHLANTASLLLPVSNLTNLLAFSATGLSFSRFALLMGLPWLAAIAVEYLVLRRTFATELDAAPAAAAVPPPPRIPVFVVVVLALTLAAFAVTSLFGYEPVWAAFAGALLLAAHGLARRRSTVSGLAAALHVPFLAFVVGLGVVVDATMRLGLSDLLREALPAGQGLATLLALAGIGAVLANVVNNLPAVLVLAPLVAPAGPAAVLAVLIGVNVGSNLSYAGSLANLLWRRVLRRDGIEASGGEFTGIGLRTVPATVAAAVIALWLGVRAFGT